MNIHNYREVFSASQYSSLIMPGQFYSEWRSPWGCDLPFSPLCSSEFISSVKTYQVPLKLKCNSLLFLMTLRYHLNGFHISHDDHFISSCHVGTNPFLSNGSASHTPDTFTHLIHSPSFAKRIFKC